MRFMEQTYGQVVSIASWMKVGVPVTLLLFIVSFFVLTGLMFRNMADRFLAARNGCETNCAAWASSPPVKRLWVSAS